MNYKKILLKDEYSCLKDSEAFLEVYQYGPNFEAGYGDDYRRPGMIVCPGGGYEFVAPREKEPVVFRFLSEGFNCFALTYSVYKKYPQPQLELACAIDYVKNHKDEFKLTDEVVITGFSAGGHLVASYGLKYKELEPLVGTKNSLRPNCIFMGYPVINLLIETHGGTAKFISGDDEKLKEELSVDLKLDGSYPPTYIWTTKCDTCVPYSNTTRIVDAFKKNGVLHECDIFDNVDHGASIMTRETRFGSYSALNKDEIEIRGWVEKACDFYFNKVR